MILVLRCKDRAYFGKIQILLLQHLGELCLELFTTEALGDHHAIAVVEEIGGYELNHIVGGCGVVDITHLNPVHAIVGHSLEPSSLITVDADTNDFKTIGMVFS